ncbi:SusF/SusE family outer membrane protein [Spirosoma taeanense]|uniref:SusF/SusE family outer membrane protein n=1 Tax=Spirosoma taeanense TaxID=2735870 RepID=A0A6M5Y218_9BACT|nr:SusE domain-containing protein [Spirosoma taeanense]QJW88727.1 SusF/SusE family outer membrane protein [Spirosoma taeanense]
MKTWHTYLFIAGLALTTLMACEKDGDQLTLTTPQPTRLTTSATSVSLTSATATNEALRLSWSPANYGFNAAVNYTVQLDKKGGNFEAPVNLSAGTSTSLSVTGANLNQNLLRLGLAPNNASQVDVRVMAAITRPGNDPSNRVYSAPTTLSVTPYLVLISYPSIYVPGAYQGWAPDKAPAIASVKDNKVYEGYIYFQSPSEFKFTSGRDWNGTNYGAGTANKLSAAGAAGNLSVPSGGYYLIRADLNALTFSATPTTWAVIGAATPKGWDADTPMAFDPATNTWQVTLDLKADEFKFRANSAWDLNFGDGDSKTNVNPDGLLDYNGDNIKVPSAGRYLIRMNLSNPGNYTYSLTKQ